MKLTELQERALRGYAKARTLKQISGPLTLQDFQEESEMSWAQLNGVVASLRQKKVVQVDDNGVALTPDGERWLIENRVVDAEGRWIDWKKVKEEEQARAREEYEKQIAKAKETVAPILKKVVKFSRQFEKLGFEMMPIENVESEFIRFRDWMGRDITIGKIDTREKDKLALELKLDKAKTLVIEVIWSNQKITASNLQFLNQVQEIVEEFNA